MVRDIVGRELLVYTGVKTNCSVAPTAVWSQMMPSAPWSEQYLMFLALITVHVCASTPSGTGSSVAE